MHRRFIVSPALLFYYFVMDQMIQALEKIGICQETCDAIAACPDAEKANEYALMCIAMYDDRHEYVD